MSVPKIRVKSKLVGNDTTHKIDQIGMIHENKIIYYENDVKVTIILSENVITLLRETNEYQLMLLFEEGKTLMGYNQMKEFPMRLSAKVKTNLLKQTDTSIEIKYHLTLGTEEVGDFTFFLEYEVDV